MIKQFFILWVFNGTVKNVSIKNGAVAPGRALEKILIDKGFNLFYCEYNSKKGIYLGPFMSDL